MPPERRCYEARAFAICLSIYMNEERETAETNIEKNEKKRPPTCWVVEGGGVHGAATPPSLFPPPPELPFPHAFPRPTRP